MGRRSLLVLLLGALVWHTEAQAGDRQLEVLLVNMTPDAQSDEASRRCVREIEKKITADYTHVNKLGEKALRKLVGKTGGEPFMSWPAESLRPAKERGETWIDAAILVDCRPSQKVLEVLVQPAAKGVARVQVQGVALTPAATELVAEAVLRRAWAGFSP